jgi:hypothetical protein
MKIQAKSGGNFETHPETSALIHACIVDVTQPKPVQTEWGVKEKFKIVYESELKDSQGRHFALFSQGYTPSLHEKAALRKDLKKILGRDLTEAEAKEGIELEDLIGKPVQVLVAHEQHDGKTYARIAHLQPDKTDAPHKPSGGFTRERDREAKNAGGATANRTGSGDSAREDWSKVKVHVGKFAGIELGQLDPESADKLWTNWLPTFDANQKPTADDKRLAAALRESRDMVLEALNPAPAAY